MMVPKMNEDTALFEPNCRVYVIPVLACSSRDLAQGTERTVSMRVI